MQSGLRKNDNNRPIGVAVKRLCFSLERRIIFQKSRIKLKTSLCR